MHLSNIFQYIDFLDNNMALSTLCMVSLNIGLRHLIQDIPKSADIILGLKPMRILAAFSIFYMATRNFKYSIIGTVLFFIFIKLFLNNESKLNMLPKNMNDSSKKEITNNELNIVKEGLESFNTLNEFTEFKGKLKDVNVILSKLANASSLKIVN